MLFLYWHIFHDVDYVLLWHVALRVEITYRIKYGNYVSFLFVIVTYFLFRHNYVIYLFNVLMFFDDVRNRVYFGTLKLRMEITLQLRFVFVRHCNVFFIVLQLRFLFVRCSSVFLMTLELRIFLACSKYVRKLRYKMVSFSYVCL